ncbi:DEAD/DEAH box helicase [Kribbella sp. NPDC050459]|uniref:DEAD/DEAH box helicase n=1 Tax=Kribbella sp. NPDC050459 TaxID=3155785 RepID=UPI0034101000
MTLPVALMGTDLIGQARTGTGKTLGFGIPLLQRTISPGEADYEELAAPGKPQALVVTPTRELTIQVAKDLVTASTVRTVRILTIYGGVAYEPQLDALKSGVDVVVGTPGRLLDLANRGVLDLSHIKVLVLDEADEMLDLGFLPDVERILRKTPELRQTMLFSATMPSAVIGLARTHMRHPLNIRAESHEDTQMVPTTAQFVYRAHDLDKPEVVARILQAEDRGRVMIFCRTKREASRLTDDLQDRGFKAAAIHGDLNQQARERALTRFRGDKIDVLVCTDVAARGIDVEGVTHVINNTCPEDEKTYIHRIGRTGRAGASGIAVTFVDWPDVTRWKVINKALDLPYDEPQEIYSTSPELYHDLGIPSEAKGRIRPARAPQEVREAREDRPRGRRDEGRSDGERPGRKRNRTRKRTRAGQPLEERADVTTKTDVPVSTETVAEEAPARKARKRTRTRKTAEAPTAESAVAEVEVAEAKADESAADAKPAKRTRTRKAAQAPEAAAEAQAEVVANEQPAKRTRTRKTAQAPEAAAEAQAEVVADDKPAKRTRTRKTAQAPEPAAEAQAEVVANEQPAKRTRTRKTAQAPEAAEAQAEVVADEQPVKRTRTRKAAAAEPAAAEAAADAKPVKRARTRKTADAPQAAAEVAAAAEDKPVKRTRTRKTAQAPAAEAKAEQPAGAGEKPVKRTRTRKAAASAAEEPAADEKPVKRARKAATTPIFSAPE